MMADRDFYPDSINIIRSLVLKCKMHKLITEDSLTVKDSSQLISIPIVNNPFALNFIKKVLKMRKMSKSDDVALRFFLEISKSRHFKTKWNNLINELFNFDKAIELAFILSGLIDSQVKQPISLFSPMTQPICSRIFPNCRENVSKYRVVIIGAGIAGLSAAYALHKAGIDDFIVLEAQPEAGGRIKSYKLEDGYIELGAQWIHGSKSKLYEFVNKRDLLSSFVSYEGQGDYLRLGGEKVHIELVDEIRVVVENILSKCENFYKTNNYTCLSVSHYLQNEFNKYLESCKFDSPTVLKIKQELYDWHLRFQIIDNSCRSLEDLSSYAWGRFQSCGNSNFNMKSNCSQIVNTLIDDLPYRSILYERAVDSIDWSDSLIKVMCTSPCLNTDREYYIADHIIITCSVKFIKDNIFSLFTPHLPQPYIKGFECFGFGTINKIFLYYEKNWWNNTEGIQLVWNSLAHDLPDEEMSWTRGITGFDAVPGLPTVLLAWVGGIGAEIVETLPDDIVVRHCTLLLNMFTGGEVPRPTQIIRSKWKNNSYIGGSYSYYRVSNDKQIFTMAQLLRTPIYTCSNGTNIPSILFAGEALHEKHYSTVHGAFETGFQQALKLIDFISSK